jgi:ATP-binding cassette subfamily C protein
VDASDDLAAKEPDVPHRGLNVDDFEHPGVVRAVRQGVRLLPPDKRRLLVLAGAVQVSLGLLDLLGIALIGLVAAVAVSGIGVTTIPAWLAPTMERVGLGGLTVSQLSVVIALAAVAILVLKTVLSALLSRGIIRFLAARQSEVSVRLAREFLSRPLAQVQRWTMPEATYALGAGVGAATIALLGSAITVASELFLFAIVGISLLIYDPLLTLVCALLFGVIALILQRVLGRWSSRNAEIQKETSIHTLTAVSEALATYREATVLNRRELYVDRYALLVDRNAVANANAAFILEIPKYVLESALYLGILVLAVVQFLTKDWAAAAATVALFLAAGSRVVPAQLSLPGAAITIRNAAVQAQPAFFMADYLA